MMVFTHVLFGILLAGVVSPLLPVHPGWLVAAGLLGGAFPDLDMLLVHRKTLHFPVVYSAVGLLLAVASLLASSPLVAAAAVGSLAAGLHSVTDVLGGGKEMRPWRETDDRAVYKHLTGEWVRPLRVFYDGSAVDLLLATLLGAVSYTMVSGRYRAVVVALVALSVLYTAGRRAVTRWIPEEYTTFSSYTQHVLGELLRAIKSFR